MLTFHIGYRSTNKKLKQVIDSITIYALSKEIDDIANRKLNFNYIYTKNLFESEGVYGYTLYLFPNNYSIGLDMNLDYKFFVRVLLHELIHCKQYITKELKEISKSNKNIYVYKDKEYPYETINKQDWAENEWEKDALKQEDEYIKHINIYCKKELECLQLLLG